MRRAPAVPGSDDREAGEDEDRPSSRRWRRRLAQVVLDSRRELGRAAGEVSSERVRRYGHGRRKLAGMAKTMRCPACARDLRWVVIDWVATAPDADGGWYQCDHLHRWRWDGGRLTHRERPEEPGPEPDAVAQPGLELGAVANVTAWCFQGCRPHRRHTLPTVTLLSPSSAPSSRVDQWVTPSFPGGGSRLRATTSASSTIRGGPLRLTRFSSPATPSARYRFFHTSTVGLESPTRPPVSMLLRPSGASSTIRARRASSGRTVADRVQASRTSRSRAGSSTNPDEALIRLTTSPAPRHASSLTPGARVKWTGHPVDAGQAKMHRA
jgi:hypothetical protein